MTSLFHTRRTQPNLLSFQSSTLTALRSNTTLLFPDADKGLGPCAVTYEQYVQDCLVHLTDPATFKHLSPTAAHSAAHALEEFVHTWIKTHCRTLTPMERKFITQHITDNKSSPFGQFYITYKIHKPKVNGRYSTRSVCSESPVYLTVLANGWTSNCNPLPTHNLHSS